MEYYDKVNKIYDYDSITKRIKHIFLECKDNRNQFQKTVIDYFKPTDKEKKSNAEIPTPRKLKLEMTSKVPEDFWTTKQKVLEPSVGKGGFCLEIIEFFMKGLEEKIPDEEERYKTIVEDCLYFADINPANIFITKLILTPNNEYKLNYYEGDSLKIDCKKDFGLDGFDLIVSNPPFNSHGDTCTGNTIWQYFVKLSLTKWLLKNGYLCMVHPPGWRKPCYTKSQLKGLFELMTKKNTMLYLEIHGLADGKKTFGCGTRYDWYIIKKIKQSFVTTVRDEKEIITKIDLSKLEWLANFNLSDIYKLLSPNNNLEIIMDSSYHAHTGKKAGYVVDKKTNEFKYPLVHSTPIKGIRYKYTNINNRGHFGIPKVIFGESGIGHVVIDLNGKYGMTQGAMAIIVKNKNEAICIKKVLLSTKFKSILDSCMFGNFRIDCNIFKRFKKDFWKDFIENEESSSDDESSSEEGDDNEELSLNEETNKAGQKNGRNKLK
jgi:hypothetical protein